MNIAQRKRHRVAWMIMAVLLPILFALAMLWLPKEVYQDQLFQSKENIQIQNIKVQ
jgi:hypothetical protein